MEQRKQGAVAMIPVRNNRGLDQHGKKEVKSGQIYGIF